MAGTKRRILNGLVGATLLAGCAMSLGGCATKGDIETLQNQNYRERQESRRTIQKLEEQLAQSQEDLRNEIQKSTTPVQARQANTWAELEALRVQVAKLQEKLDTLTMKFNTLTNTQAGEPNLGDMAKDIQNIKVALQSQFGMDLDSGAAAEKPVEAAAEKASEKAKPASDKAKAAEKAKPAPKEEPAKAKHDAKTDTAEALFARADAAYKAKKYDTSLQYYSEFFTNFKKHPKAPDAAFWVGESAFNLHDYGKAALAYQEVIEKFPRSSRYRPALLKQGMAFFKIGKDKAGRAVLQDLIDRFPNAPESTRAKQVLKEHK